MIRRSMVLTLLALLICAGGLVALPGCSDDGSAPHDEYEATAAEMANQTGLAAFAIVKLVDQFMNFAPGKLDGTNPEPTGQAYQIPLSGEFNGNAYILFKRADEIVDYDDDPDWAWLFTIEDENLVSADDLIEMALDLVADSLGPSTATVNGTVTVWFGPVERLFTVTDLSVVVTGPPVGGTITYSDDEHVVTATFDGTNIVEIDVDGTPFLLDLDTGEVTEGP